MDLLPGAEPYAHDGGEVGVLLCHGYPGTPQSMRPWGESLAGAGYTVRIPRLPGMGTNWRDLNATTWQDWYGAVADSYADLTGRCTRVFAGGLSMGGLLATKLAEEHPELAGLMVVNPIYRHNNPALPLLPVLRFLLPFLPGPAGDIKKANTKEIAYQVNPLKAMYSQTQLWKIVTDSMPLLTLPIFLATSAEDHVVPALSWRTLLERVKSADVTHLVLENSYHVATLDNDAPELFARSIDFIDRVVSQRPQ